MQSKVVAFVPCRKGSQRVPAKNTRPFAGIEGGLVTVKLRQLSASKAIDEIVVSTDDPVVAEIAEIQAESSAVPIRVCERPAHLATSSASTDAVIAHVPEIISEGAVLWTHVTSPFVDATLYDSAIKEYRDQLAAGTADSLMSVTPLHKFLWNGDGPLNYDRIVEKWPRTQTLAPVYEVNSAIFIADVELIRKLGDRIGHNPCLFKMDTLVAVDVDWEEDFVLCEALAMKRWFSAD